QRFFDAPPLDAGEARTVTGNCGLRRDRVPGSVRFDEVNTPMVAEDVAFGHAARAAGIRIRWLAGAAPGLHVLPERIDEVTERLPGRGRPSEPGATAPVQLARLLDTWRARRGADRPVTPDELDHLARGAGFGYRDAGAAIERAAARR